LWFTDVGRAFRWWALRRTRCNRPFLLYENQTYTYGDVYRQAVRYANLFGAVKRDRVKEGRLEEGEPLAIGIYQENTPEYVFALFGAALSGDVLFGINTGFRGETLANCIQQASVTLLLADPPRMQRVESVLPLLDGLGHEDLLLVDAAEEGGRGSVRNAEAMLEACDAFQASRRRGRIDIFSPLLVIYTSGTTGAPKGVPLSHLKMLGAGVITRRRIGLTRADRGYVTMPLFHANSWYLGILPILVAGGSFLLKRRFSARAFEEDILESGATFMNYVGQPLHYILHALESKYGSAEAVEAALARHPRNRFRMAHGNGASAVDREKFVRYLGMEHVYEAYGSTEAPISTVVMPGDPVGSVGRLKSRSVVILNEHDRPCPPGVADDRGRLVNYEEAVGEIAKRIERDNIFFDRYVNNPEASEKKFRGGYFRSGDLGHVRVIDGKRYLYFNGRTDDWIRKDGENFSAENVLEYVLKHPDVELAVAYGAPCEVSDEKVMVAVKLKEGTVFDPRASFEWFTQQQETGMDPKWMPDYIRIVDAFSVTETQKIVYRSLKSEHFNIERHPDMKVYFRRRGDDTFRPLTKEDFSEIKKQFAKTGREELLARY
jgi:fatty-acyl-CoA synthase